MDKCLSNVYPPKVEPSLLLYIITYPQAYPQAVQGAGVIHRRRKALPQVLRIAKQEHILPNKKYTLKLDPRKCPTLYTYLCDLGHK